jgi:hypothetical protein
MEEGAPPIRYSIVCIIHGDGDYLYHDIRGKEHRADEEALAAARTVARQNPEAEVFIFHEKPRKRLLWLFSIRHDGKCYYYRNGRLAAEESYRRDEGRERFEPEVKLHERFRAEGGARTLRAFCYFGHEIPEFGGAGYDASYGKRVFRVDDLEVGLRGLAGDSTKFDMIVLSTCYGGTPYTIAALAPFARYILASPGNLHLSYFDLGPFERLDVGLLDGDVPAFARKCAQRSFDRLTAELQTEITVGLYDVDRVRGYLRSVSGVYARTLASRTGERPGSVERCDCAEEPAYVLPGMSDGVEMLYRPARFGRMKNKPSHSGWECWRLPKSK